MVPNTCHWQGPPLLSLKVLFSSDYYESFYDVVYLLNWIVFSMMIHKKLHAR